MRTGLSHIDAWIFDLDNTLYPAHSSLFPQIDARMGLYIQRLLNVDAAEAHRIQKGLFHSHGMTLPGLMALHNIDPHDFLAQVHDVDLEVIRPHPELGNLISRLPGRKFVFTNADAPYAERVLERLGLTHAFDALHDIHALDYVPKPQPPAYLHMCQTHGITPTSALFVEDMARNLAPAKAIGMTTVWIDNGSEQGPDVGHAHIDYRINDLAAFLAEVLTEVEPT
ncbi:pyrimidine 5'-nucleotidase [Sandarakinorhabdus oryzae]|uniref:pyrimidine 5'-nucleotidase n=1 Tax=Sandarakinorhabdus oryzae TaxID=2675220 RepID=UPI0012E191B2|nr:pyrimidine 5'-nucleotidase [Sandarakinorhabdus oryzae]